MKKPLLFVRHLQSLLARQSQQMGNNGERDPRPGVSKQRCGLPVNGVGNRGRQALGLGGGWKGESGCAECIA